MTISGRWQQINIRYFCIHLLIGVLATVNTSIVLPAPFSSYKSFTATTRFSLQARKVRHYSAFSNTLHYQEKRCLLREKIDVVMQVFFLSTIIWSIRLWLANQKGNRASPFFTIRN